MRATTAIAALLGCAAIAAPAAAFTGGASLARAAIRSGHNGRSRRSAAAVSRAASGVRMMAVDPATVHSLGDYVNAVGSAGVDHAWLSHVMHGERRRGNVGEGVPCRLLTTTDGKHESSRLCLVGVVLSQSCRATCTCS